MRTAPKALMVSCLLVGALVQADSAGQSQHGVGFLDWPLFESRRAEARRLDKPQVR